jgi:hypothetical protein
MYVSIFLVTKEIPEDDLVWIETCRTKVLIALSKSMYLTVVNKIHLILQYSSKDSTFKIIFFVSYYHHTAGYLNEGFSQSSSVPSAEQILSNMPQSHFQ